eukprot:scaffold2224_cov261-Pinguiococcus_pyrenoidosus.AAC.15
MRYEALSGLVLYSSTRAYLRALAPLGTTLSSRPHAIAQKVVATPRCAPLTRQTPRRVGADRHVSGVQGAAVVSDLLLQVHERAGDGWLARSNAGVWERARVVVRMDQHDVVAGCRTGDQAEMHEHGVHRRSLHEDQVHSTEAHSQRPREILFKEGFKLAERLLSTRGVRAVLKCPVVEEAVLPYQLASYHLDAVLQREGRVP